MMLQAKINTKSLIIPVGKIQLNGIQLVYKNKWINNSLNKQFPSLELYQKTNSLKLGFLRFRDKRY